MENPTQEEEKEINLDEIEKLIEQGFQGGSTELGKWFDDSSYTQQCFLFLNSPNPKFNTIFFAFSVLIRHVDKFFCYWETSARFDFAQEILQFSISKEDFLNENSHLIPQYAQLAGSVIAEGWINDNRFQDFLFEITKNEPKSIVNSIISLNILEEVSESMRRLRVSSFGGDPLASIIEYSFKSIEFPDGEKDVTTSALKSILSALNFYSKGFDNKIEESSKYSRYISMDEETQAIVTNLDFIQQIFIISQVEAGLCFEILFIIISNNFKNIKAKKEILLCFIDQVCEACSLDVEPIALTHLFNLILRLKKEIDYTLSLPEYDYEKFITTVYEKSKAILDMSTSIQNDGYPIAEILSFFETLVEKKGSPLSLFVFYENVKHEIVKSFTNSAISLLSFSDEIDADAFGLDKSDHFHPWFMSINKISNPAAPETLGEIFTIFDEVEELNNEQVSLMCILIMSIIYDTKTGSIKEENYEQYSDLYNEAFVRLVNVFNECISSPFLINTFLLFLRHYKNFGFLVEPSSFSTILFKKLSKSLSIDSINEMFQHLLEILYGVFQECSQEKYLLDACKALEELLSIDVFQRETFNGSLPIVQNIVKIRVENPFPFLLDEKYTRIRTAFHKSLAIILINNRAADLRNCYLSIYCTALTEPTPSTAPNTETIEESLLSYLCDFTGFFKFAKTDKDFQTFYSFILSNNQFEQLSEHTENIASFPPFIMIQLVKFWNALLSNDQSKRIQFRHHSNNGLSLFHYAVDAIQAIVKTAMTVMKPGDGITRKLICYVFRIIDSLLVANYVPYNCFDYYGDTGLIDLLNLFRDCLEAAPPKELKNYPKLEKILINLAFSICSRHIEATAKPEVMCTEVILDIINFGLSSMDTAVREKAIDCLTYFMCFRGIFIKIVDQNENGGGRESQPVELDLEENPNAGLMEIIPKDKLIISASELWNILLADPKHTVIKCIKEIFGRLPEMLDFVQSKMEEFLIQDEQAPQFFQESYEKFFNACSEMFQGGDDTKFESVIKEFVNDALKCLRAPTKVFTMMD